MLRPSSYLHKALRLTSNDMRYVERVRLLDYWSIQDSALASEFRHSSFLLMVDRKPLVKKCEDSTKLSFHSYSELQKKLGDYGLSFDSSNSCLLDAVDQNGNEMVCSILIFPI
nr:C. briggsae CBR-NDX-9 protein [Haemonchus contortus]